MNKNSENNGIDPITTTDRDDSLLQSLKNCYNGSPGDSGAALRLAQYYVDHGWYNQAMDVFRESLKENGDDYTLLLEYGNTCFKKGEYSEAGITFKKLTEIKPDRIEGWNNLGIVQIHEGNLDESFVSFSKVISIEPDNAGALLNMGNYQAGKGESEKALNCFKRVVEIIPSFADAWYNLGNTYLTLNNLNDAIDAFEKALKYKTDFPSALKNLGYTYEKVERLIDAELCYLKAIDINKADSNLRSNLGLVQLKLGKTDDARECFLKSVRLAPQDMSGWMGLRQVSLIKGDIQTFTRATLAVLPRLSDDVIAASVEKLYDLNQIVNAEEIIKQVDRLGMCGDLLDIQRIIAYFQHEGMSERVLKIYKRLSSLENAGDDVLRGLARFAFNAADFENVIGFVNKMKLPDTYARGVLWRSLIKLNRGIQARRLIQNYLRECPECYECWFLLADIEANRGNRIRAEKLLVKALENGFTNIDEINQNPVLKDILDIYAKNKDTKSEEPKDGDDMLLSPDILFGKQVIV